MGHHQVSNHHCLGTIWLACAWWSNCRKGKWFNLKISYDWIHEVWESDRRGTRWDQNRNSKSGMHSIDSTSSVAHPQGQSSRLRQGHDPPESIPCIPGSGFRVGDRDVLGLPRWFTPACVYSPRLPTGGSMTKSPPPPPINPHRISMMGLE